MIVENAISTLDPVTYHQKGQITRHILFRIAPWNLTYWIPSSYTRLSSKIPSVHTRVYCVQNLLLGNTSREFRPYPLPTLFITRFFLRGDIRTSTRRYILHYTVVRTQEKFFQHLVHSLKKMKPSANRLWKFALTNKFWILPVYHAKPPHGAHPWIDHWGWKLKPGRATVKIK